MKRFMLILASLIAIAVLVSVIFDWNPMRTQEDAKAETVVVLHGLGRSNLVTKDMAKYLFDSGYNVKQIGYQSLFGDTPDGVVKEITDQINACCTKLDTPVHFVGHSLGGLLVRRYLGENTVANLGRVVLMGSPNKGTPIVDGLKDDWLMKVAGEMARALGTDDKSGFLSSLKAPTYPLGVIAGVLEGAGRGEEIPGDDDGLVPLDSTKVEGMSDFIILPVSHSDMRKDAQAFSQLMHFLKEGKFDHQAAQK